MRHTIAMPLAPRLTTALLLAACSWAAADLTVPQRAGAHAIESSLERVASLNNQLLLETHFGNGEPADAAVVRLIPPVGAPIVVGLTDARGRLQFRVPSQARPDWEVQVDRGSGHRDYLELPPATSGAQAHRVAPPLRAWLDPASAGVGVGLIGLCSLGLLLKRRR